MKRITISAFILVAGLSLLLTPASAQACCGHCWEDTAHPGGTGGVPKDVGSSILNTSQQNKIISIRRTFGEKLGKLRRLAKELSAAISTELAKPELDAARLKELHRKRSKAASQMKRLHDQMEKEIKKNLTKSQLKYYTPRVAGHWCSMGRHGWTGGHRGSGHGQARDQHASHDWSCCGGGWW